MSSSSRECEFGHDKLVSIILTTLNAATYLHQALDSCLNQTYENLELIVVDGGSTDGTLEILASYTDPRIRLIHQKDNVGKLPGAINLGLEHAKGAYLTWMQADSYYTPDAIARMVDVLEQNPDIGQAYADFYEVDREDQVVRIVKLGEPDAFLDRTGDPAGVCFLIRRSVRDAVGIHNVNTHPNHDYDYRMRIALRFPSFHIREPLYYWRYHPASLTGQIGWLALARKDTEIRVDLGLDTPRQARRRRAEIEMAYAFECYQQQRWRQVPRQVWAGLRRDWRFARNLGVWSILFRSLARSLRSGFLQDDR
jgi:glycosyltransferase involved in cell wall biosynthesis